MDRGREFINYKSCLNIVDGAVDFGMPITTIEGTLLDSYVINTGGERLIIGERKTRYIILASRYRTPNSSIMELILTDSKKKVKEFLKSITFNEEEYEDALSDLCI